MSLSILTNGGKGQIDVLPSGKKRFTGVAKFSTTDANGQLACPFRQATAVNLTPIGADDGLYVDNAAAVNASSGLFTIPSTTVAGGYANSLKIARTGSTSGLLFAFDIQGIS